MKHSIKATAVLLALGLLQACGNSDTKSTTAAPGTDTARPASAVTPVPAAEPAAKPAIINIIDTISPKRIVLCFKDSAAGFERIGPKLALIYGVKLAEVLKKNNLKMDGPPMAWYKGNKAPFFFEAGVPVAKKPAKLSGGAYVKELTADSAVVAHFFGPYNLLSQGYDALNEWLKDQKKKSTAPPYEIYFGDPMAKDKDGKTVDPYTVRTDIVFPHH